MEHRWRLEGIRSGEESLLEQYDGTWRWRISHPDQADNKDWSLVLDTVSTNGEGISSNLKREQEKPQKERDQANLDRDQAVLENDKVILERDLLRAGRDQAHKLQEIRGNCDSTKSELEQLQRKQRKIASGVERKMKTSIFSRVQDGV